ncbi:MAG TPA: IPT/TIG domain-containing protein [Acidobacteriota bacterium]|nr:IPT/TIG domain-containing protein [Acidobacteriota bacterium]
MKRQLFCILILLISSLAFSAETIRRNIIWTLEGKNDPIVQVTNDGDADKSLRLRILIGSNSWRYPDDLNVPSGEHRFLRVREIIDTIGEHYPEVKKEVSGLLQIEYDGLDREIQTRMVNLNPKAGVTSTRETEPSLAPSIVSIDPKSGNPAGGTTVTISGHNFTDSTVVKFGGVPALHNRQSADVIVAVTPPHTVGAVDVEVGTGKRGTLLKQAFLYEAEGPLISMVDPDHGSGRGGTRVLINGRNFQPGCIVLWDGIQVTARYIGADSVSLMTPPGRGGSVSIEIRNPGGKSDVLQNAFTYQGAPHVVAITPQTGSTSGGYSLTLTGRNFEQGSSVMFGTQYGTTTFINPQTLSAIVPAGQSGPVDIIVSNPDGEVDNFAQAFLYNEPPHITGTHIDPNPIVRLTTTTITVDAVDPEGGPLQFSFEATSGPTGGQITGVNGNQAIYASPNTTGIASIRIVVQDEHGAAASTTVQVTVE